MWWKCKKGPDHEWQLKVRDRTVKGRPCPFCVGRRVSVTNSLEGLYPKVAAQWHPSRNGKQTAADVFAAAKQYVWWRCGVGHVWRAAIRSRTLKRRACPACAAHL